MHLAALVIASGGEAWCWIISILIIIGFFANKDDNSSSPSPSTPGPRPRKPSPDRGGRQMQSNMSDFEIRVLEVMRGKNNDLPAIAIEARGVIPVFSTTRVNFVAMAMDVTDDTSGDPLLCLIPDFQWPDNLCYRSFKDGGNISPNHGFSDWVEIGVAPTDTLVAPRSGRRKLKFTGMVVRGGSEHTSARELEIVTAADATTYANLREVGYREKGEKRLDAIKHSVRLGIAVAYSDGSLAQSEGKVIRDWVSKQLEQVSEESREEAKAGINDTIRNAGQRAKAGQLNHEQVATELRTNTLPGVKLQALELCVQVMSADGVISPQELALIRRLGDILGVSHDDVRKLIDKNPPTARAQGSTGELTDEEMVGLPKGLTNQEAIREIRKLFANYNGRQTNEKDAAKRAHNQRMLEALARLRVKYGS